MNNFDYKNMTPFKWFVLENFPFIENDFDAINNYRLFSKVVEYLNKTIDNVNVLGNLVEQFSDYFDNLDVQEEINNKLDEMVEDGTLVTIIQNYLDGKISTKTQVSSLGITPGNLTNNDVDTINNYIASHPFCSLEFDAGTYTIPKSIKLLQGCSINGVGNDTKIKTNSGVWAIICKGLADINSTTEIYNLTIDGDFNGNGIYIDGTRYSRCEIHDIFIVSCLYGLRNAKPTVDNVYDNNFGVGNGGNNLHDIYIYGETPNDDSSRCIDGLVLFAHDNFISNVRVSGFNNYGTYINGSSNQFSNLKCAVNHIGCKIRGGQNFGLICAEESFQNNFELLYLRNSNLILKTANAGCVVSDNLPVNLAYYDVDIQYCSQNELSICGFTAQSFTYRKAGELAFVNLLNSMLNKIDINFGNAQVPNKYCLPLISNCGFANDIKINTNNLNNFINYNILENIDVSSPTNVTITGDYPNLNVVNSSNIAIQNLIGLDLFDYIDNDLVIFDNCFGCYPPQLLQIQYRFSGETTFHNYISEQQFISSYGENGSVLIPVNIKDILETQAEYIEKIQQGETLAFCRIFLRSTHAKPGSSKHQITIAQI